MRSITATITNINNASYMTLMIVLVLAVICYILASSFNSSESGGIELCASGLCYVFCFGFALFSIIGILSKGGADVSRTVKNYERNVQVSVVESLGGEENLYTIGKTLDTYGFKNGNISMQNVNSVADNVKAITVTLNEQEMDFLAELE